MIDLFRDRRPPDRPGLPILPDLRRRLDWHESELARLRAHRAFLLASTAALAAVLAWVAH